MKNRFEELKNEMLPRFWDTENKEMIYPEYDNQMELVYYKINKPEGYYEICLGSVFFNNNLIPMKPTGLKDKNGSKLIYEGDVVRFNENDIGYVVGGVRGYCYDVICPQKQGYGSTLYHIQQDHNIEVIGNIHENSDLLK